MTHKLLFGTLCCSLLLGAAAGCKHEPSARVKADFTTDKEVYNLYDEVVLTNLSSAEGAEIDVYKWEWGDGQASFEEVPSEVITSDEVCSFRIRLTAVASSRNVGDTCSRVIRFVDENLPPEADFTWSPEFVYKGQVLQFTDTSTDDGKIKSWLWNIGGVEFTEQNPSIFAAPDGKVKQLASTKSVIGDIDPLLPPVQQGEVLTVTLTVTDNGFKTDSVTKEIMIYTQDD